MSQELLERQIKLEEEGVFEGIQRYEKTREHAVDHQNEDTTKPAQALMRRVVDDVAQAIEMDRNAKRRGKNRIAVDMITEVSSAALAWHALRAIMAGISRTQTYVQVAIRAGRNVKEELNYLRFSQDNPNKYKITQQHFRQEQSPITRQNIMRGLYRGEEAEMIQWKPTDQTHVGAYIVDIALKVTGWATVVLKKNSARKTVKVIHPTPEVTRWLAEAHGQVALLTPIRRPMIVPPVEWTGARDGGYITAHGGRLKLVKTYNDNYLDSLEAVDMPEVYAAINAIQQTPWKINHLVTETAKELWGEGVQVGPDGNESLPPRQPKDVPTRPAKWDGLKYKEIKEEDREEYKVWVRRVHDLNEHNRRMVSKRTSAKMGLELAERFTDDTIWFPYQLDFRGRLYPVASYLNPQGDDLQRGLLLFSEGKRLGSEGSKWLRIHVANCFGVDKVSFEDRIAWVEANMERLLDSGLDPLGGGRFWMEAEAPFQALAACGELVGYSLSGDDYVSHLPISMDGSCNGLQNFSALLRDEIGGKATNLLPSESPEDIYQEVADVCADKIAQAAAEGNPDALIFDGFISRSLIKQPVMTLPYGATLAGMQKQLEEACRKAGNPMSLTQTNSWGACGYLAKVVREAISEVVVAAVAAMDWLQVVARTTARSDMPVSWTTPCGFPVLQEYKERNATVIRIHIDGMKQKLHVNEDGTRLDKRRQAMGIAPNFVHSLDAAHLMKTTLLAKENGIEAFAMIHDSFGTHAADVSVLQACIREAFVQMYSGDVLQEFKEEVEYQHGSPLPDVPPSGTLELERVKDSQYFFA